MKVSRTISSANDGGYFSAWEPLYNKAPTQPNKEPTTIHKEDYTIFGNGLMQAQSRMVMMYGKNKNKNRDCVVDFS